LPDVQSLGRDRMRCGDFLYEYKRLRDQPVTLFFPGCHDAFPQSRVHCLRSKSSTSIELHPS
jgi:hypothetical protein